MKKLFCCFLLFVFCFNELSAQKKNYFSIEIDADYYHYVVANAKNRFNYGSSLLISADIARIKVSSGINWSKEDSYYTDKPTSSNNFFEKRNYRVRFLNIPVLVKIRINQLEKIKIGIVSGLIYNKLISSHITSYYLGQEPLIEKDIQVGSIGFSWRLGAEVSKLINQCFEVNISPFISYRFIVKNQEVQQPVYRNINQKEPFLGFKVGIAYVFYKDEH